MPDEAHPVNQVLATEQPVRDLVVGVPGDREDEVKWVLVDAGPVFNGIGEIIQI